MASCSLNICIMCSSSSMSNAHTQSLRMEAVKSDPTMFDLEAEILNTTERILKLREEEEFIKQQQIIMLGKVYKIDEQINGNKHRKLKEWIDELIPLIESLEKFPNRPGPDHLKIPTISPTAKEIAEPTNKLKIQFQHKNKNLATERKLAKELQQQKENEEKQHVNRIIQERMQKNRYYSHHRNRAKSVLPRKDTRVLIRIWAEELLHVCSLVLHDSRNLNAQWRNSDHHLLDLFEITEEFYRIQNIGRAEFEEHWDKMKCKKNSLEAIKFELMKESRRHQEGYNESERLREKMRKLGKSFDDEFMDEWKRVEKEEMAAHRFLWKLKCKQNEAVGHSSSIISHPQSVGYARWSLTYVALAS